MPPIVAIDARDAAAAQPRGWGRYTRELVLALRSSAPADLELRVRSRGGAGPEVLFEQLKLPAWARRTGAAVIHSPNCFLPIVRSCPGVVTIHDLAFEAWPEDFVPITRTKYRTFARLAARSAERVICPSSFTRADVCERYGVEPAKVRVIAEAPALGVGDLTPPSGRYLLAVGDLRKIKNLSVLVEAFVALRRDEGIPHRLVLAGIDSGEGPRLLALARHAPVELTGYISDARLDALIRGAEVLIHASLHEGFGLVVLEAMQRGTPVVAARAGALPETAGVAAEFFEPHESEDLQRVLRRLLSDASVRATMATRGLEHAARFSWQRAAHETAAVYRELV